MFMWLCFNQSLSVCVLCLCVSIKHRLYVCISLCTGCNDTLAPLPQPKLKIAQYKQPYCRKVKSISAMDFQYFHIVSIFASFLYSRTKMLKFTKIALKTRCLIAFILPCMDSIGFYGILLYWSGKPHVLPFF